MLTVAMETQARSLAVGLLAFMTLSCAKPAEEAQDSQLSVQAARGEVAEADERAPITVESATRAMVLKEMRTMLKAVQGVVGGIASGDTAAMKQAASMAGMKAASESDPAVRQQLGGDFIMLGILTHARFDSLAADIATGNRDVMLRRLGGIMGNCVGCHEKWRLVVEQ